MSDFKPEKRMLPARLDAIFTQIQCPSHQVWPFKRTAISGLMPLATLNCKTFEWHCQICGDHGLITRAFRTDYVLPRSRRGEAA